MLCFLTLDEVIWECYVYAAIIPDKCKLFVRPSRVEVRLKKRNPRIYWMTLHDEKVCTFVHYCGI